MRTSYFLSALLVSSVMATNVVAADTPLTATVNFHGKLVASGCTFESDSQNKNVDLGYYAADLINEGNESTHRKFDLKIGSCKLTDTAASDSPEELPIELVQLTFQDEYRGAGYSGTALAGRMTQASSGTLNTEIHVKLGDELVFDGGKEELKLSEVKTSGGLVLNTVGSSGATLNFEAWMKKESNASAQAGDVYGQMTITLTYL